MLGYFKSEQPLLLSFEPELVIYDMPKNEEHNGQLHIRIASGDTRNINRNIRVSSENIKSISLELASLEKFICLPTHPSIKFIDFTSNLVVERLNGEVDRIELAEHRVGVEGHYSKIKKANGKSQKELTWISFEEAAQEINDIWQEEFADALDGYMGITPNSSNSKKSATQDQPRNKFSKMLNLVLIFAISFAAVQVGIKIFTGNSGVAKHQTENTVLENLTPDALNQQAQLDSQANLGLNEDVNKNSEKTASEMALEEFGLEPGVNLDQ